MRVSTRGLTVYHYSIKKIKQIQDTNCNTIDNEESFELGKPGKGKGLWFTNRGRNSWLDCYSGYVRKDEYKYVYKILLKQNNRLLQLYSDTDIEEFGLKYGKYYGEQIYWNKVCKDYDAVYLKKWHPGMDDEHQWYWSWNCISGIIFKTRIIKNIKEIEYTDDMKYGKVK